MGCPVLQAAFQRASEGRLSGLPRARRRVLVPEADRRRLAAYTLIAAYDTNQAAALLGEDGDDRRDRGDPALIVDKTLTHLIGEAQQPSRR